MPQTWHYPFKNLTFTKKKPLGEAKWYLHDIYMNLVI